MSLFILPFDHRGSFKKMILGHDDTISAEERAQLIDSKNLIFEAFKEVGKIQGFDNLAVLVDEEFGSQIHEECKQKGIRNLLSMEKSGQKVFEFERQDWKENLQEKRPAYAKALIRIVMGEDHSLQNARLSELSAFCEEEGIGFLLEPLVFPSEMDLQEVEGDKKRFDLELRQYRFSEAVTELHEAKVFPDVWKIEGTDTKEAMQICSESVQEGGKSSVEIVLLGRGESKEKVELWLKEGAKVEGVSGFAVGRTIFAIPIKEFAQHQISREEAIKKIADEYEYFINLFESAKK
jgi:myo-inositol catabolism protein IolC